ncbi:hypothetical protein [Hellea balneolensis]|uniref:hypothetical protein n=1 Tax=Hellea balneolensis TaxID=287478 RepID=UPI00041E427F|nr:hypothetical protein [Hellea balneolensis]
MRYSRYHFFLDLFGVAGLTSGILFANEFFEIKGIDNAWVNFLESMTPEFIGIYISIRIIDYIFQSYQSRNEARIGIARSMRVLQRSLMDLEDFRVKKHLWLYYKERDWFENQFRSRAKFLNRNEVVAVQNFLACIKEIDEKLPDANISQIGERLELELGTISDHLERLDKLRIAAQGNILEEFPE